MSTQQLGCGPLATLLWFSSLTTIAFAVDYEVEPIRYSQSKPHNAITRLQEQIDRGEAKLTYEPQHGYLKAVLEKLKVPKSSQVLGFAKTSMQAPRISPETPRAIYFNDDVHLGYVRDGIIEIAVADPKLGTVFYTLEQAEQEHPTFRRLTNNCLTCHAGTRTRGVPGLQVRSVFPDPSGQPVIAAGSFRTNHASPFKERWGGWYVSGKHGDQAHLGNFRLPDKKKPKSIDNSAAQNCSDLSTLCDVSHYLTPHSDLVALMVLEHQADGHNLLTIASFEGQVAEHQARQGANGEEAKRTRASLERAADDLVKYLLFSGETPLTSPVSGTSAFAAEFGAQGPKDKQGRSLRQFDLAKRMFKHPCSYLVYSAAFDGLPEAAKALVYRKLNEALGSDNASPGFEHLSSGDRQSIREILLETKPEFGERGG